MGKKGNYVRNGQEFGRVIFLAHSLFFETSYQNLYFNYLQNNSTLPVINHLVKKEKDLLTFLLGLLVNYKDKYCSNKIKRYLGEISATSACHQSKPEEENNFSGYWRFDFDKDNIEKEIDYCLDVLTKNKLIIEDKNGILSPTINGVLVIAKGIKVETYLHFKHWMRNSKKGEISDLELLIILSTSRNGKDLPIPFSRSYRNDDKRGGYNHEWDREEIYWHRILGLIFSQGEGDKEIYRDKFIVKEGEEEISTLVDYMSCKKILLLFDWIKGNKKMKSLEQEYILCEGDVVRLAEGFCWLADSLAAIVESGCWKKKRKEDLEKIILLSERLIEGIEEEGLSLARLYILGLSRDYIRRLVGAGYGDEECLKGVSEEELGKILPKRLVKRIQERIKEDKDNQEVKKQKFITEDEKLIACKEKYETENLSLETHISHPTSSCSLPKTKNQKPKTVLEISLNRPDRIIFMGEKIEVTATEFSLIHLLAQHNGQVMSYDELLEELWKGEEDAIYNRVSFHISKIRRTILKTTGERKINEEKVKDIFVVVPKRGVMLKLTVEEIKINK